MSIQAVIFDMDGVIIDSESLWRQAQIDALAQWGATASVEECETLTKGKRLDEIARTWCRHCQLELVPQRLEAAILQRITGRERRTDARGAGGVTLFSPCRL